MKNNNWLMVFIFTLGFSVLLSAQTTEDAVVGEAQQELISQTVEEVDSLAERNQAMRVSKEYKAANMILLEQTLSLDNNGETWQEFTFNISDKNLPLAELSFILAFDHSMQIPAPLSWRIVTHPQNSNMVDYQIAAEGITISDTVQVELDFPTTDTVKIMLKAGDKSNVTISAISGKHALLAGGYRIMPIGDSITFGKFADDSIGFRKKVFDQMEAAGMQPDFVGYSGSKPYEGHFQSGRKIEDFYPKKIGNGNGTGEMDVTTVMNSERPQMVLIHLGTNDLNSDPYVDVAPYYSGSPSNFSKSHSGDMASLINYLLEWHNGPRSTELQHIIVCTIIPLENRDSLILKFNAEIGRMVRDFRNGRITGRPEPVVLCDQFSIFRANLDLFTGKGIDWMSDDKHPNTAGHNKMGEIYFSAIEQILQPKPRYFDNVAWTTETTGTNHYFGNYGVALADVNKDGIDDIYTGVQDDVNASAPNFYFQSRDSIFAELAKNYNLNDPVPSQGVVFVDIDNDGDFDLFVGHYGKQNRLYRNDGGAFSDITTSAGISNQNGNTTTVLAFDAENDGDMDLYAVNSRQQNELYLNNGSGSFTLTDRGANDVVEPDIASPGAAVVDIDLDGDPDLYIAKKVGANVLFINDGRGYFSNQAAQFGLNDSEGSVAPIFADYDNDGDPDLFLVKGREGGANPKIKVFRNNSDGTFTNVSASNNLLCNGFTGAVADFDNDGDLDLVSVDSEDYARYYENTGGNFTLRSDRVAGIWGGDARSAAVGDLNNDGGPDVYLTRKNTVNAQLKNVISNRGNYLKVRAQGPKGDVGGLGTKLKIYQPGYGGYKNYFLAFREVTAGLGNETQNSPVQHFGLGDRSSVDLLAEFSNGMYRLERSVSANRTIEVSPLKSESSLPPKQIAYESGNHQSGSVGTVLANPLQVKVTDANGNPVKGVPVSFTVTSGAGELLFCDSANSDLIWKEAEAGTLTQTTRKVLDSQASNKEFVFTPENASTKGQVTLDFAVGKSQVYYLWIRIAGREQQSTSLEIKLDNGSFETWNFTAASGWRWERVRVNGSTDWSRTIAAGSHSLVLALPVGGPFVDRVLLTPDGQFVPYGVGLDNDSDPQVTDASGVACRKVRLGSAIGSVIVQATASYQGSPLTGSPIVFNDLKITSDIPSRLVWLSPDSLRANGGEALPESLQVQCFDQHNNVVPNTHISFVTDASDGRFSPAPPVLTQANGKAAVAYYLGRKNRFQTITASMTSYPGVSPIRMTAIAEGIASNLAYVAGNYQEGYANEFLTNSIQVKVTSASNDAIEGHPVVFRIIGASGAIQSASGTSSQQTIVTDKSGIASVRWRLGTQVGADTLEASAAGLNNSPMFFYASTRPGPAASLVKLGGDSLSAPVYKTLAQPIRARVTDVFGNWVANQSVSFRVIQGGGKVATHAQSSGQDSVVVLTSSDGSTSVWWTLGGVTGSWNHQLSASSWINGSRLQGVPLTFYASATSDVGKYLELLGVDNQTGRVGEPLSQPFCVRVKDQYGNPVPNFPITFQVSMGDGKFYGHNSNTLVQLTGIDGKACATLVLGCSVIKNGNQVRISADGLEPGFLLFTATGTAGTARQMVDSSGNNQIGKVAAELSKPLVVQVLDDCKNGVANQLVNFQRQQGNGSFVGESSVLTDSNGFASVRYKLGTVAGENTDRVAATAYNNNQALFGTPVLFWLSAQAGDPFMISDTLGNHQTVFINDAVPESLGVEIKDAFGNRVPGVQVRFKTSQGSGTFQPSASRVTGADGKARVSFVPATTGDFIIYAQVNPDGQDISGSPARINLTVTNVEARRLSYVSGDNQTAVVGRLLSQPFVVQVVDDAGRVVPDFNVTFTVQQGNGTLENQTTIVKKTDSAGKASVFFKLGTQAGLQVHRVLASAKLSANELTGSPVAFKASAIPGSPDVYVSRVEAQSPVPANGALAEIKVILTDQYGNPIAGKAISLTASGCPNFNLHQPISPTDSNGVAIGYVSSVNDCSLLIKARIVESGLWLNQTDTIRFIFTSASRIVLLDGDRQSGNAGTQLKTPLRIKMLDLQGQPVSGYPVQFKCIKGNGKFVGDSLRYTMSDGIAQVSYILSSSPGQNTVHAYAYGLTGSPVIFTLTAREPVVASIESFNGSALADTVGKAFKFQVRLTDLTREPVANMPVQFQPLVETGIHVFPASDSTNSEGVAETQIQLGRLAGQYGLRVQAVKNGLVEQFTITALPGKLDQIKVDSGNNQTGIVSQKLPNPLVVKAVDRDGNGIAGIPIEFQILEGGGQLTPGSTVLTDASGNASVFLTLGSSLGQNFSGIQILQAKTRALPTNVLMFYEFAKADRPAALARVSPEQLWGRKNAMLSQPVQVQVKDGYGNPVDGTLLAVTVLNGGGSIKEGAEITCNRFGIGSFYWTLGGESFVQKVKVAVKTDSRLATEFTAIDTTNAPPRFTAPDWNEMTIAEKKLLEFTVSAVDPGDEPITYGIEGLPARASFVGQKFSWLPDYDQAGDYQVTLVAMDRNGIPARKQIRIQVQNVNRKPNIMSFAPTPGTITAFVGQEYKFSVLALDPDHDPLSFQWYNASGDLVAQDSVFFFRPQSKPEIQNTANLLIKVADQEDTVILSQSPWQIQVKVQLKAYSASVEAFKGVRIYWRTDAAALSHTAGFRVLRGLRSEGPFTEISEIIPIHAAEEYSFYDNTVRAGMEYFYVLEDIDFSGASSLQNPLSVRVAMPKELVLHPNYPNPFNPSTQIRFELPQPAQVKLIIYNVRGEQVYILTHDRYQAGFHALTWQAQTQSGTPASSGVYYAVLETGGVRKTIKMLLIK